MNIHAKITNAIPPVMIVICGVMGVLSTQMYMELTYPDVCIFTLIRNADAFQTAVMAIAFETMIALEIILIVSYALIAYPILSYVFEWGAS